MQAIKPPRVSNWRTLYLMLNENSDLKSVVSAVCQSRSDYRHMSRHPANLECISIGNELGGWLRNCYDNPTKKLGSEWISDLRNNHSYASCPMCGSTGLKTLDHILPKANYPELATYSYNLVPSCNDCNQKRGNVGAEPLSPGVIHPYFDHEVLKNLSLSIKFEPPFEGVKFELVIQDISPEDTFRVEWHLEKSIDENMFKRAINSFWSNWWYQVFKVKNYLEISKRIQDCLEAEVATNSKNSWHAAFLRGLHRDKSALSWMEKTSPR